MMQLKQRILVAIKGSVDPQPVIQRTLLIAERLGAEVVLMAASRSLIAEAEQHQQQALEQLTAAGIRVRVHRRQLREPLEEVVWVAREQECGLLIKAPDHPRGLADTLLTPRDSKLLRYSPCPVLIVKQDRPWEGQRVLAAIDAAPGDSAHLDLNQKIIKLTDLIATLANGRMTLVSAYPTAMQSGNQSPQQIRNSYRQQAEQLCQQLDLQPDALIIEEGPAETLIPAQVLACDAPLVVLGTVARKGLSAALLGGNTAEAILSQLACDVLTVQPEGDAEVLALLQAASGHAPPESVPVHSLHRPSEE